MKHLRFLAAFAVLFSLPLAGRAQLSITPGGASVTPGTGPGTVAAGDDARIVGAVQRVIAVADLRALPVPTTSTAKTVSLAGYYTAADGGGGDFTWDSASTLADNQGTIIRPAVVASGSPGRWLRVVNDATRLNVLWFGAKIDAAYSASAFDSLPAFNAAVSALPNADYSSIPAPGAGGSGHIKTGTIEVPGTSLNQGFVLGGTLYLSPGVSLVGNPADGGSLIAMKSGVAPSAGQEKWLILYLNLGATGSDPLAGSPSNNFFSRCENLFLTTGTVSANPGGSCLYFQVANNGIIRNVNIGETALRGAFVNSTGCVVDGVWSTGPVHRGPSVTFTGSHIVATHLSPEHTNSGPIIGDAAYITDASDGLGDDYPALLLDGASDCIIGEVQCENSRLGVKIRNGIGNWIGSVSCNVVATGVKIAGDSTNNALGNVVGVSMTTTVRDVSGSSGYVRNETRTIQRQPYAQNLNAVDATLKNATVANLQANGVTPNTGTVFTEAASGRRVLHGAFSAVYAYRSSSALYLVRATITDAYSAANGQNLTALVSLRHNYQQGIVAETQVIQGAGLGVVVTDNTGYNAGSSTYGIDFHFNNSVPSANAVQNTTVTQLTPELGGVFSGAWTAAAESDSGYLAGTATGTLSAQPKQWTLVSAAYTAVPGDHLACDLTTAAFSVALPATPTPGDSVRLLDAQGQAATHNLTVTRASAVKIAGTAADLTVATNNADAELVWVGGAMGWQVSRIQ